MSLAVKSHKSNYRLTGCGVQTGASEEYGQRPNGGEVLAKAHSVDPTVHHPPDSCSPVPWHRNGQ